MSPPRLYSDVERKARKAAREKQRRAEHGDRVRAIEAASRQKTDAAARVAKWRLENAERVKLYFQNLYRSRKDAGFFDTPEFKAASHAYYLRNKEAALAVRARWKKANPELVRAHGQTRRAKKLKVGGVLSKGLILKLRTLQRNRCANCKERLRTFHLDHIEPLSKGGVNEDRNMQLLCPTCNLRKHAKDPIAFAQEQGRLL